MFERFTDRSRRVIHLAHQEARRYGHEWVGTEHLLLGLLGEGGQEGPGIARAVLEKLGTDLQGVREVIEMKVIPGVNEVTSDEFLCTPRLIRVIELTKQEAENLNHGYVGTEHLLLALCRERAGMAVQVLLDKGLDLDEVRNAVLSLLGHNLGT